MLGSHTKKPPEIRPSLACGFSLNSETNPLKLFERKTIKEQMKQWDKAAELKQQKKYPVLKNKN